MVLGSGLVEKFHPVLDVLLHLQFFIIELFLEQFGTILNERVSVYQVALTAMSHFDYF